MRVVRWFVGSWLSRIYLAVVVVVTVGTPWSVATLGWPDANMAEMRPLLLTMPVSLPIALSLPDGWTNVWSASACALVGGMVNAAVLNGLLALARGSWRTPALPAPELPGRGPKPQSSEPHVND